MIKKKEIKEKIRFTNNKYPKDIVTIFVMLFIIITIVWAIFNIINICHNYGMNDGNLPQMLKFFREKNDILSGGNLNAPYDLNFLLKQFIKISYVLTVFYEYFFVKAFIEKKKNQIKIEYFVCIVLGLCCTLLSTGRSILFHMIYALFIIFVIYNRASSNKIALLKKEHIKKIVLIGFVCFIGLYALMPILGRKNNGGIIESTTFAIGTHIPALNKVLRDSNADVILKDDHITFNNAEQSLKRLGIINAYNESENIWYRFNRYSSNTFTSLFSFYHDFNYFGVFLLQFVFGFIATFIYLKISKNKSTLGLIFYSYFFYTIVDQIRGDQFYGLLTLSSIAYVLIIVLVYFVFFKMSNVSVDLNEE